MAGHMGHDRESGIAIARPALTDPEPAVRATALGALIRLGALELADIEAAAADPSPVVRARAGELAYRFGPAAVGALIGLLHDREAEVVEAACFGLGELGAEAEGAIEAPAGLGDGGGGATAALAEVAVGHADPLCREAAVAAIGAIGSPAGLEAVLAAMQDKPAVRRRAVLALASFDGPEVEEALERGLVDRDWQVRQAAEDLTGRRPGS